MVNDFRVGDWADHKTRDLDPREVIAVAGNHIVLVVGTLPFVVEAEDYNRIPVDTSEPSALYIGYIPTNQADECLVTLWPDGSAEIAFRQGLSSWSEPETLTKIPEKMKEPEDG